MEVDEDECTQRETASYHSLRTSLSLDDLRTALLHNHCTSPCKTAVSLTQIVEGSERWRQFLGDTMMVDDLPQHENRPDSDAGAAQRALLENVIASIHEATDDPSLSTARRHSFRLTDGDSFLLEVPDQYDDPWAPPNTPEDGESVRAECTTTCSTMGSISPSASRERIAAEVGEYLLVKGGAWHANVNDSIRVEVKTPIPPERSRSRSPHRIESTTCRWEESGAEIRDCGQ